MKSIFSLYIFLSLFFTFRVVAQSKTYMENNVPQVVNSNFEAQIIENKAFCNFVIYRDDLRIQLLMKNTFGFLPDHIAHLPLAYKEEDFPIKYWIHEDMPEGQRKSAYEAVAEINVELDFTAFIIEGIDYNEVNFVDNRKDQKNVIYWFNQEQLFAAILYHFSENSTPSNLVTIGGATILVPHPDMLNVVSYPIFDVDILLNNSFATDRQVLQVTLGIELNQLGIENPPLNADVIDVYNMLIERLETINIEEFRTILIEELRQRRRLEQQSLNELKNKVGLPETVEAKFNESFARIDKDIFVMERVPPLELQVMITNRYDAISSINLDPFQSSSSIYFKSVMKHELLHGLGLDHYEAENLKPFMRNGRDIDSVEDILIPEQVDIYAKKSLSCLYDLDRLKQRLPL